MTGEIFLKMADFIGRMKRDVSHAFLDLFYALKKWNIFLKAKLQAGFESFLSKRYSTTVQISVTPIRTYQRYLSNEK